MENINTIIANNLSKLRKKACLTQLDLAEKMKYSNKTISKWENGEVTPNIETLSKLCDYYHIRLDDITHKMDDKKGISKLRKEIKRNQLIITLLAISLVWIIATIIFVYSLVISNYNTWEIFLWALPVSCIVALIFNSLWGKTKLNYVIISIFIWTLLTSVYLQFLDYNLIAIYFLGIPAQISVLLWSGLKKITLRKLK